MASDHFTGERPGWGRDFDYDESRHLAAYIYAATLAGGKRVLDAGCGEGFGTQTLVGTADSVTGVDYSAEAVAACKRKWNMPGLEFFQLDLTSPGDFNDTFDLVLNFQVLEHIEDELPFLEGLRKRLAPGGVLMLTTPNRLKSFSENPYHVREYTAEELRVLLGKVFSRVTMLGTHGNARVMEFDRGREKSVRRILRLDPLGLRKLLPASFVNFAFAKLAVLVRRQARKSAGDGTIRPDDFSVGADGIDEALDLVALCEA
ncbi:MAG: class I SAM-dependent methyltransferase [Candidatus Binatia bacterium]